MKKFTGVITAIITPFKNNQVDFDSLARLIDFQVQSGVDGFVVHGTTGESPVTTQEEKKKIFEFVRKKTPEGFPLIVGTGSNSTQSSIEASREAERWGADGLLLVVPYYNKPPQRGLLEHFKSVASSVQIPSLLYNVPGRTITSLEIDTIKKLSEHPQIIGIKEATGNIEFAKQIKQACGESFVLLSGDDGTYDDFMKIGGHGVISVSSHIIPKVMKNAQASQNKELIDLLFCEANPIPVKMALHLMKILETPDCRLPLVTLSSTWTEKLKDAMKRKGLL